MIYAVTSGAEGWEAIEQFGKAKLQWLRQLSPFAKGSSLTIVLPTSSHVVSAWADTNRLVLGQEATAEKSNEITAPPKLLELLERKGGQGSWAPGNVPLLDH